MSKIFVYDERDKRYLEVPNSDQEYSKGLTEFSHDCILKRIRQANSQANQLALAQAKERFMEEVAKEMKLTKGARAAAHTQLSSAQIIEKKQKESVDKEVQAAVEERKAFKMLEKANDSDWEVISK
ncbi:hypothetical protein MT997_28500 [Paenibacillus sp. OVF10]|nr:hypothetical protein MT997_28500 [Paenibacillus sp. OVF10]